MLCTIARGDHRRVYLFSSCETMQLVIRYTDCIPVCIISQRT